MTPATLLRSPVVRVASFATVAHFVPSVATIPAVRAHCLPRLAGKSRQPHVALTFDDGPDPASTPAFLDALRELDVRATFFLLGTQLQAHPDVARAVVADGHEVAVHGWRHRPHLLRAPWDVWRDIARATASVGDVCGERPRFWRPPNGVLSGAGFAAAWRLGLQPVLWTADGQDWSAAATASSTGARISHRLQAGGTVLLHDSDVTSAPGSWRAALGALPAVVERCRERGWAVGPLREHWI